MTENSVLKLVESDFQFYSPRHPLTRQSKNIRNELYGGISQWNNTK